MRLLLQDAVSQPLHVFTSRGRRCTSSTHTPVPGSSVNQQTTSWSGSRKRIWVGSMSSLLLIDIVFNHSPFPGIGLCHSSGRCRFDSRHLCWQSPLPLSHRRYHQSARCDCSGTYQRNTTVSSSFFLFGVIVLSLPYTKGCRIVCADICWNMNRIVSHHHH